jgi:hypothetical protein
MGTCLSRFCPSPLVFERTAVAGNDEDSEDNDDADNDTDVWSARVTKEAAGEEEGEAAEAADRARADGVERLLPAAAGQVPRRIWV